MVCDGRYQILAIVSGTRFHGGQRGTNITSVEEARRSRKISGFFASGSQLVEVEGQG